MIKNGIFLTIMAFFCLQAFAQKSDKVELTIIDGEYWWGGLSSIGHQTPYNAESIATHNLWGDNKGNQAQPLLLSSKGRYVWSEQPINYSFNKGKIMVSTRDGEIISGTAGKNLRDAYNYVSNTFFPSNGKIPEELLFTHPQYNTWIELMYDQNEADILEYAQSIIDKGYPPGVLMIDDNWQENYGVWEFSPRRFSAFWDIIPTFSDIAGISTPENIDGVSFLPELKGEEQKAHDYLYWEFHEQGGKQAIRKGKWKMVKLNVFDASKTKIELYNLENDPSENQDISTENPDILEEMTALLKKEHIHNPDFPFIEQKKQ